MAHLSTRDLIRWEEKGKGLLTGLLDNLYPHLCMSCRAETSDGAALCQECWPELTFVSGAKCSLCALPMTGQDPIPDLICDGCQSWPRNWSAGAAAILYEGTGRRIILSFKHGDRQELAVPIAAWMATAGAGLLHDADLIVPVPLHWTRMMRRKFNQSALLARRIARISQREMVPNLLTRVRATPMQKGLGRDDRVAIQSKALAVTNRFQERVVNKTIVLVDDVLTTGATAAAASEVMLEAGAKEVRLLVAARVAHWDH